MISEVPYFSQDLMNTFTKRNHNEKHQNKKTTRPPTDVSFKINFRSL